MKRFATYIIAMLLLLLCGCSSMLDKEYLSVSEYDAESTAKETPEVSSISSYQALTQALGNMVIEHQETAELQFSNYAGNISEDLAEACWQVKTDTALGEYVVDYISYDISRIVTYYQATVYINYNRTLEEMQAIESIGANKIAESIQTAAEEFRGNCVLQIYTSEIDGTLMTSRVMDALLKIPNVVVTIPNISVDVFSGNTVQKIFDIKFEYEYTEEELAAMREELSEAITSISDSITADEDFSIAVLAAKRVAGTDVYAEDAESGTAYNSLVSRRGDSRAIAMGYSAICEAKGLDSLVVLGLKNNKEHYWNLVMVDGHWYHVDAAEAWALSFDEIDLCLDSEMISNYRWDELDYPNANGPSLLVAPVGEETQPPVPPIESAELPVESENPEISA